MSHSHGPHFNRTESQLTQTNLAYSQHGCGVKASRAQTFEKLGFYSPAYTSGRSGTHGIIGSAGYLSASYSTLLPATGPRSRDAVPLYRSSSVGHMRTSKAVGRGGSSTPRHRPALSEEDLEYLRENEKRGKEAWEAWRKERDNEMKQRASAALRWGHQLSYCSHEQCLSPVCLLYSQAGLDNGI